MNLELKDFQQAAVGDLLADLHAAKDEILRRDRPQAIALSAPTASGKTVIITALIEKILGGDGGVPDDYEFDAEPDAVFLWLSDQPELNRQSRLRLLAASNLLRPHDLVIVGSDLDAEFFDGGKVFFLNSQKLGRDKLLTRYGDGRHWTIWETIRNTQRRHPDRFYIIIDEAHRGMNVSAQERAQANSIVQKFILGSAEDGLPPANLIIGVSATPERFTNFLAGTNRPLRQHPVDAADVRASGLIKDRIVLHPGDDQPSPWTLLAEACTRLTEMTGEWQRYTAANDLPPVDPALIIQIEDGTEHTLTRTALGPLIDILQTQLPGLAADQIVHCLQAETPITIGNWRVRSADPSSISADASIRVVLFKTALTTGWDCPRAEVMISFRAARDATYIAQLVGRMVRTPLAERIFGNERLNDVYLFLPRYDETTLVSIIDRLTRDKDNVPASDIVTSRSAATFRARQNLADIIPSLRGLPRYTVTNRRRTTDLRRLVKLARMLTHDAIDLNCRERELSGMVDIMLAHLEQRRANDPAFRDRLHALETVTYPTLILHAGELRTERGGERTVAINPQDLETLFTRAKTTLTEDLAMACWRRRYNDDEPLRAKVETYELANDAVLWRILDDHAGARFNTLWQTYRPQITLLPREHRARYEELRIVARHEEAGILDLPETITLDIPPNSPAADGHLYVDDAGLFRLQLTGWEQAVLAAERDRPDFVTWVRNIDRKSWSLGIPYELGGQLRPLYPDFIVVRRAGSQYVADLLEPHRGEDSVAKAKGLADFADRHGNEFGRIEMIRMEGPELRRLDFNDHRVREAVLPIQGHDELTRLFDNF